MRAVRAVAPRPSRHRLLDRGDLPGSDGGLYNPGAWLDGDRIELCVRREIDYRFTPIAHAERVVLDAATLRIVGHNTLVRRGFPDGARLEDFRPLRFGGETLCVHSMVHANRIRPVLSRLTDSEIVAIGPIVLPVATAPVEKNWVLFEHHGELHCLYRLDPLTIFARTRGGWRLRKRVDNGFGDRFEGVLSNSANLVPFDGGHLGFWHSRVDGRYVQGALLLDDRLDLACATGVLLDGRDAAPGSKPGVFYVSSLVVHGGRALAFYGEGDAHSGVAVFDAAALATALRKNPFTPSHGCTVRLAPRTMGELYRAMVQLDRMAASRRRAWWAHVPDERLHEAVRRFGVRGLKLRDLSDLDRFDHDAESLAGAAPAARKARRST